MNFTETRDVTERLAVALIAVVNGDNVGAAHVLDGIEPEHALQTLASLLTLTAQLGVEAYGPQGFVRAVSDWRDELAALPDDWWEKRQRGDGS